MGPWLQTQVLRPAGYRLSPDWRDARVTVMTAEWVIDELDYAGPEHLDPDFVSGYDRKQGFPAVDPDLRALAELGVPGSDGTVVDLGTGTGRFAIAAASRCRRVVAVDVSPAMLAHVRQAAEAAGVLQKLECVRAGFLSYEHQGAPADAVYTRNALHQLPDFWKGLALHRIAGILRPGGVLRLHDLVYDFTPAEAPQVLEAWMSAASEDPARGYTRQDFMTHVRTEFSTFTWLLEPLLSAAGFRIVSREIGGRVYATYTCIREQ
jgi:ubiquinone/menaquinone biosynthesis C-methylase UbiE